jgi:hypothetical protein
MSNIRAIRAGTVGTMVLVAAWFCRTQVACGQMSVGNISPNGLLPILQAQPPTAASAAPYRPPMNMQHREPLARLIVNPDQTDGAPPLALTDQSGTIQRYVEPMPGIDLTPYIGQVIAVRNDTGTTLLASQLDLPQRPLRPMISSPDNDGYATATRPSSSPLRSGEPNSAVQQVQYVDNDDSSVQLLPDDVSISDPDGTAPGGLVPMEGTAPAGNFPAFADPMGQPCMAGPGYAPPYQPMPYSAPGMMAYPNPVIGPYPNQGPYSDGTGNDGFVGDVPPDRAHLSADVQLNWLRPQVAELAMGKLSEKYEFSPTIFLGIRGAGNFDGRVRFWHYDHDVGVLGSDDDVRFRFNVLDIEAVHRFGGRRSEINLAAGIRLAGIHLTDINDQKCGADFIGLTMAADGLTPLGNFPNGHLGLVYGGRLSLLGGNWGGDDNCLFINQRVRNDNVVVDELYGGLEVERRFRVADVHARALFQMQNWKSDVLDQGAFIDSIGFFGPGLQLGAEF